MSFDYLIQKILNAPILDFPFEHIIIDNFLSEDDFDNILHP